MRGEDATTMCQPSNRDSYSPLVDSSIFSGPKFVEDQVSYNDSLPTDMQRLSVCEVSLDDIEHAPYQPPNALPLLVKSNPWKPPKATQLSSSSAVLSSKDPLPQHDPHLVLLPEPLAKTIQVEVFRADMKHDSESAEDKNLSPVLYFEAQCDVSNISRQKVSEMIADKFEISNNQKLLLKAYDPLLSGWVLVASERGLDVILLHCLDLHVPLKISFRVYRRKSYSQPKDIAIEQYNPAMKRTNFSKILLPEIKHRAEELPFTFSRPRLQRNVQIANSKQEAFAEFLENRLIATRW